MFFYRHDPSVTGICAGMTEDPPFITECFCRITYSELVYVTVTDAIASEQREKAFMQVVESDGTPIAFHSFPGRVQPQEDPVVESVLQQAEYKPGFVVV